MLQASGMALEPQSWVVINTHAHRERFALDNLERQNFRTYCPMLQATVRHARKTREVLRPMFPGYVFAGVDPASPRWRPLLSTLGVRSVVRSGDRLSYLSLGFIDALRARELNGAIVRPASPYRIGQSVKIVRGAFDGLVATIIEMDERDRLVVLMDLLNRPVKVKVDVGAVAEMAG